MKKIFITFTWIMLMLVRFVNGQVNYDFSAVCSTGQTLFYKILGDSVVVTYPRYVKINKNYGCPASESYYASGVSSSDGGCFYISSFYPIPAGRIVIPDSVTYGGVKYSVKGIGSHAFDHCNGIKSITIPLNITSIANNAFAGINSIDTIIFETKSYMLIRNLPKVKKQFIWGDSVECVPSCSYPIFSEYTGDLVIPNSIRTISDSAFYGCNGIKSVIIGENVKTVGKYSFCLCNGITGKLTIPDSLSEIDDYVFYGCSSLDSLVLGPNVKTIGTHSFMNCSNLSGKLVIPESVKSIGDHAFYGCAGLDSLDLGSNVKTIGTHSFMNCTGLSNKLVISDSVNLIGDYAFYGCSGLNSVVLGSNVTTIGIHSFMNCAGLSSKLVFPDSVSSIGSYAFYGCVSLDSVILGSNVKTIGAHSFMNCTGISGELAIPDNVCSIGDSAFYNCVSLNSLRLGSNVQTIGTSCFENCHNISGSLIIPNNVKSITARAFMNCYSIDTLFLGQNIKTIGNDSFRNCNQLSGKLTIPDSVEILGSYAFFNCSSIDSLEIGLRVTAIGDYAFQGCSNVRYILYNAQNCITQLSHNSVSPFYGSVQTHLETLVMNNVQTLPNYAFSYCTNLTHIQFSPTLQSLSTKAFYNCDNLLSVDFDSAQVTLGDSVFADCDRLVTTNLGSKAISIGNGAFAGCFRLTTVNMGNAVTSIGNNAFRDCIRLVSPKLSNALLTIGSNAFKGCSLITGQLNFPENVTSIGSGAYSGCSGVTSLLMKPQNPPTIYASTFDSININIPVYVPCGRVLNYYVTDYWENFPNILEMEPYQVTLSVNNDAMGAASVTSQPSCTNPQAIIAATSNEGFHFTHWSDGNTNNPRVLSLNQDTSLVANFTVNQAYITVHSNDSVKGHVSGSGLYIYNAPVVLMATANEGYHFIHWNDGNTQNPRYVTAIQDSVFTAIFVSNLSNINVLNNNPEMGTVSGSGVYYYQNYATLSATPNYGYHFTHWNDGNTDNPRMLFVDRDTTFIASFALNVYAISASSENTTMGSVSGGGNYTYNMQISLTANANFGYHFSQWSDGNTQNPRNVVVTKDSVFTAQFAANTYTLSVSSDDPDMGSAYGAGTFTYNSQTTISAAANYGYHFTQWSDGNTENPRIVTINGNREYIAMFAINFYTITVNSSNPALGSASGGGTYNYNSNISISATPNYGYHFTQWSDGNTQNPRNITVMQNATYTAQFAVNTYSVTVNSNNASMGTVLGAGNYIYQTPATISAMPNYGYHFVQWNDGNTDNPRTIIITQNEVFSAQFDYNTYTLTALSNNYLAGTVTGGGSYNYTSVVSVLAVPNEHYHFVQWSDLLTDNPRNITMTQDTLITAQFEIDQHTINVQSANATMGSTSGGGSFSYGTSIPISATANYGYHFVSWSDGSTQNPRTVMVSEDASYIAMFEANLYVVNSQSSDDEMGIVTGAGTYPYLATVTLQAIPQTGHHFTQWSDGNTENPRIITLTNDTVLNAQFAINMYSVNILVNDSTMGSVSGSGVYPYLSQVTISATAAEHHHFVQWGDGSTSNPRQFTVTSDLSLEAIFAEDAKFLISAYTPDTLMGQVYGAGEYYAGTQISLTAVPNAHYQFVQWTDGVTDNPRSVVVLENATFMAVFSPLSYDILAYSSNEMWGTVYGTGTYDYHTAVTLEAVANPGYHFVCWNDGDSNAVRTILVEGNAVYIASFAEGVGVEEHQLRRDISIYPNPTTDMLYIDANDVRTIEIFNIYGQLLAQFEGDNKVDMSGFDAGTYIVRITHLDGILEKKVIKI